MEVGRYDVDVRRAWGKTILWFLGGLFAAAIVSCTLLGISEILEILESSYTSHNTTAKTAGDNWWKCRKCGKMNASFVGTCGCGARRPEK